jgi:hypothetical protein
LHSYVGGLNLHVHIVVAVVVVVDAVNDITSPFVSAIMVFGV